MKGLTIASVLLVIVLAVMNLAYNASPEPDVVYEMANRNIVWNYAGK